MKKAFVFALTPLLLATACAPRYDVPFRTDPQNKDVLIYQSPSLKVTSYAQFLIDPVKVRSNQRHGLKTDEEKMLSETFRKELSDALEGYPIVNQAGPGVLEIRTTILDIEPAHAQLDEDKFLVLKLDTMLTRVSMEIECLDSASGERVAALIYKLNGSKFREKDTQKRFLNIEEAFGLWARSLRQRFEKAKSRPDGSFDGPDVGENEQLHLEEGE